MLFLHLAARNQVRPTKRNRLIKMSKINKCLGARLTELYFFFLSNLQQCKLLQATLKLQQTVFC